MDKSLSQQASRGDGQQDNILNYGRGSFNTNAPLRVGPSGSAATCLTDSNDNSIPAAQGPPGNNFSAGLQGSRQQPTGLQLQPEIQGRTGFIGAPTFSEWVTNTSNLSFVNGLNSERLASSSNNVQVGLQTISDKLKLFDNKLLKMKKLQLEVMYFNTCLDQHIVPKGLRYHQYLTGLIADSPFHLELEVFVLNTEITTDLDFLRYKFDYERSFFSIDQLLERLKTNKLKKINRDRQAYDTGTAYPKPSSAQSAAALGGNTQILLNTNADSTLGNMGSPNSIVVDNNDNTLRRSERIRNQNYNNSNGTTTHSTNMNNRSDSNQNFRVTKDLGAILKKFNNMQKNQKNKHSNRFKR
ncbi:putative uncharacterized protein DDB_G0275317 [Protopterus annectens]|uniref:putative uncharacterized protein DDB_G0275317 n=1 Tax=Protopterus annectens TaxID=7888 RepID=UPI001CFBD8C1|nr:putative uncharacterized protein DDB_G0275317 [Protopterus annectens]